MPPAGQDLIKEILACLTPAKEGSIIHKALVQLLDDYQFDHNKTREQLASDRSGCTPILFTSMRKRAAIIIHKDRTHYLYTYGSAELILKCCSEIYSAEAKTPLVSELETEIRQIIRTAEQSCLRIIAIAYKQLPEGQYDLAHLEKPKCIIYPVEESGLTLLGFMGIKQPLRAGIPEAMQVLTGANMTVRAFTGDSKLSAVNIARECQLLPSNDDPNMALDPEEFDRRLEGLQYECESCQGKGKVRAEAPPSEQSQGRTRHCCPDCGTVMVLKPESKELLRNVLDQLKVLARCHPEAKLKVVELLQEL